MVKNQLFRVLPDLDIIQHLLNAFGLTTLEDTNFFTKDTINELNTVSRFNELKEKLNTYYLPCKSRVYLLSINKKKLKTKKKLAKKKKKKKKKK